MVQMCTSEHKSWHESCTCLSRLVCLLRGSLHLCVLGGISTEYLSCVCGQTETRSVNCGENSCSHTNKGDWVSASYLNTAKVNLSILCAAKSSSRGHGGGTLLTASSTLCSGRDGPWAVQSTEGSKGTSLMRGATRQAPRLGP